VTLLIVFISMAIVTTSGDGLKITVASTAHQSSRHIYHTWDI
jgi:hypothetical protein